MKKLIALLFGVLFSVNAFAVDVRFSWEDDQQDISKYNIYCGNQQMVAEAPGDTRELVVQFPDAIEASCYMTAVNIYGVESDPSNTVVIPSSKPSPPVNFQGVRIVVEVILQ